MNQAEETKIKNKVLDAFQELRKENLKLKLENEKLKKQLKDSEKFIHERAVAEVEWHNETEKGTNKLKKDYIELKKSYDKLYDALYECETMLRECSDLQWGLEKIMPTLKKLNRKREKKYKYKVTHDEIIIAGPPDSLGSFGCWKDDRS